MRTSDAVTMKALTQGEASVSLEPARSQGAVVGSSEVHSGSGHGADGSIVGSVECGVRASSSAVGGSRLVASAGVGETQILEEASFRGRNGDVSKGEGGFLGDGKGTEGSSSSEDVRRGGIEEGDRSEIVRSLNNLFGEDENGDEKSGDDCDSTVLIGDGSDRNVDFDGNGISLIVEVHGPLGGGNMIEKRFENEEDENILDENGGDSGQKLSVPVSLSKKGKMGDIAKEGRGKQWVNESGEENELGTEAAYEGEGEGDDGDQEHEYSVGDFVWGKVRSHPWWPGRIYDASDASENALKYDQIDRFLVAYFGDGSFSWCSPSQLQPFSKNFEEMSRQSSSKVFVHAVQKALDEIGRLLELKMTCSCICEENRIGLVRPLAANAGIKGEVLMPDGGLDKISIPDLGPAELLAILRDIAQVVSINSMLELTFLKSWLSSFYCAKGRYHMAIYHDPLNIEGLEDKNETGVLDSTDLGDPVEATAEDLLEEEWLSSPARSGGGQSSQLLLQKCPGISQDKLYRRRKQKSVAELMGEDMDSEPKNQNDTAEKERASSWKKKRKSIEKAEIQGGSDLTSPSGMKRGRKKKAEILGFPTSGEIRVASAESGDRESKEETIKGYVSRGGKKDTGSDLMRIKKKDEILGFPTSSENKIGSAENGDGEDNEETHKGSVSKEGKRNRGNHLTSQLVRRRGRKKKVEILGSPAASEKKIVSAGTGESEGKEGANEGSVSREGKQNGGSDLVSPMGRKRGRKKKAETSEFPASGENKVASADHGEREGEEETDKMPKEGKKNSVSSAEDDDKENCEKDGVSASRERKKSKYLSPPFTNLKGRVRDLSLKKNSETESVKIAKAAQMGERMTKAAEQLISSPPIMKCSGVTFQEKDIDAGCDTAASPSSQNPNKDEFIIDSSKINAPTKEVLSEVRLAALSPLYLEERNSLDMIMGFFSTFRSAVYLNGSNYKIYHSGLPGRKRKSLYSEPELRKRKSDSKSRSVGEELKQSDQGTTKLKSLRTGKVKPGKSNLLNVENPALTLAVKANDEETGKSASLPVTLMVTFPPVFPLPSRDDLIAIFSKFGAVNEMETDVLHDSHCARVVFLRTSDAEQAFSISMKKSPFGAANVNYRLRYPSSNASKASKVDKKTKTSSPPKEGNGSTLEKTLSASVSLADEASRLLFIRQKLEMMASMMERSGGEMSPEMKSNLQGEMKGLLEKVNRMAESVSA